MISFLLAVGVANGADPTYERLFSDVPSSDGAEGTVAAGDAELPRPWRLAGPVALGALGLLAAWRLRARAPQPATEARPIVILGRQPLGDRSALVLVEVVEPDGERRRLLIGTGASAPTLVADLGVHMPLSVVEAVLAERVAAGGSH